MDHLQKDRKDLRSGIVWILSALALSTYGTLGLLNYRLPGVEEIVSYISSIQGTYLYGAAFLAILIEGIYFLGSFFPGTTLVIVIAILSQLQ